MLPCRVYGVARYTRRSLLGSCSAILLGLAGCVFTDGTPTESDDDRDDDTTTGESTTGMRADGEDSQTVDTTTESSAYDSDRIDVGAAVLEEPTDDRPAIVELTVTNRHDVDVPVVPGERSGGPLENLPHFEGQAGEVVPFPVDPAHLDLQEGSLPDEPVDGCWRWPGDVTVAVEDRPFEVRLGPGETYRIRHRLYQAGDAGCFPDGTYTTTASLTLAEWMASLESDPDLSLTYVLTSEDGGLDIAVDRTDE